MVYRYSDIFHIRVGGCRKKFLKKGLNENIP